MDLWMKARVFAEEAAKRSQELTKDAARLSQEFVAETAKMSKEMAAEAAKKAEIVRSEALRAADQIKAITVDIPIPIPSALGQGSSASAASDPGLDLERFGVTEELREFVQGIKISTFRDFPMQDEPEISDACTVGNVRQDLNEWQARHATLVLSTVKEISKFRYELCPRYMKERKFWRIYFILVDNYVARYEKQYMEGRKEETKDENKSAVQASAAETKGTKLTPEDLDVFLLGDLGSDDEDLGGGHDGLDGDFDKIGSTSGLDSDIEKI